MHHQLQELLTNKNQVLIQIIEIIAKEERWFSIQELSQEVGLVERSLQRYVLSLEDTIHEFNGNGQEQFVLEMRKNKGIKLLIARNASHKQLNTYIYEQDHTFQLLIDLLFERYESIQEYSQKRIICTYAIKQSFEKIGNFLEPVGLEASISGFYLKGEESQVRGVIYSVTWMLYNSGEWPFYFHQLDPFKLELAVNRLFTALHLDSNMIKVREISYILGINILRHRGGHEVSYQVEWESYIPRSHFELNDIVETMFGDFHIYSQSEVRFMALNLSMFSYIHEVPHLKRIIIDSHKRNDSDIIRATNLFISEFNSQICPITPGDYDEIYLYLFRIHLFAKVYRQGDFEYCGHSFTEKIQANFINYYEKAGAFINQLWHMSGNDLFLEERFLIQKYFMVVSITQLTARLETAIRIEIQTDLPLLQENRLKEWVYDQFKGQFNLAFIDSPNLQKPDLTLTNIPMDTTDHSLLISYPICGRDMDNIKKELSVLTS